MIFSDSILNIFLWFLCLVEPNCTTRKSIGYPKSYAYELGKSNDSISIYFGPADVKILCNPARQQYTCDALTLCVFNGQRAMRMFQSNEILVQVQIKHCFLNCLSHTSIYSMTVLNSKKRTSSKRGIYKILREMNVTI